MSFTDITLLILLGGFALFGFWFGLIHTIGSLVGTAIGAYIASHYYDSVSAWALQFAGGNENLIKVIVFIVLFFFVDRFVGFLFWLVEKAVNFLKIIPFVSSINRLGGLLVGLIEGALVLGLAVYFISKFPFSVSLNTALQNSDVATYLTKVANILLPLLPEALRQIESFIHG